MPILVKHPVNKEVVLVNFDPVIYQLVRETNIMLKMGLEVPEEGQHLAYIEKRLKDMHHQLIVS